MKPPVLLLLSLLVAVARAAPPNIIVILADDLGYGSAACYGANQDLIRTPHIDRLAREGMRFTDACAPASVCSPTRYALLTGRYCFRTPLKHGIVRMHDPLHIETGRPTVASLLKQAAYASAAIGKWHLGYTRGSANYTKALDPGPLETGFDHHFGLPSNHGDGSGVFIENHRVWGLRGDHLQPFGTQYYTKAGQPMSFMGLDAPQRVDEEVPLVLLERAISWIDRQKQPFFLYYAPVEPHVPVTPSRVISGSSKAGPYGDWIHELDLNLGKLLDHLDRRGLAQNTLVIFTSDNGGENKPTRFGEEQRAIEAGLAINGHWRAGKHTIYEGGFRVPFIARWPGRIPAGVVSDATINLVDLPATLAAITGVEIPEPAAGLEDSFDRSAVLLGKPSPPRPFQILQSADGVLAVRDGPWKWSEGKPANPNPPKHFADQFQPLLFNLADDPGETENLLQKHPETAARLAALLARSRELGRSKDIQFNE